MMWSITVDPKGGLNLEPVAKALEASEVWDQIASAMFEGTRRRILAGVTPDGTRMAPKSETTIARVKAMRGGLAAIDLYLAKLEAALEGPLNAPLNASVREAHRAAHKPGTPSKIDADPQVRAFILDRLDSDTLTDIVAQVKAHFPRERHVSRSGLHRWWHKKGKFLMAKRHQTKLPQSAVAS